LNNIKIKKATGTDGIPATLEKKILKWFETSFGLFTILSFSNNTFFFVLHSYPFLRKIVYLENKEIW
jgi:hypothetical protein